MAQEKYTKATRKPHKPTTGKGNLKKRWIRGLNSQSIVSDDEQPLLRKKIHHIAWF